MPAFNPDILKATFLEYFGSRLDFLCAAGSVVHNRSTSKSDIDLMIVLSSYEESDISICRRVVKDLGMKVDLSLQYYDELPINPEYVHDGYKTSVALTYINSAYTIYGNNPFSKLFKKLPKEILQRSIIEILDGYLHTLYAKAFECDNDNLEYRETAFKFLTRTMIDVILYYQTTDNSRFEPLSKKEIFHQYKNDPNVITFVGHLTEMSCPDEIVQAIRGMITSLKFDYGMIKQENYK